jgi:hypothetical protein
MTRKRRPASLGGGGTGVRGEAGGVSGPALGIGLHRPPATECGLVEAMRGCEEGGKHGGRLWTFALRLTSLG